MIDVHMIVYQEPQWKIDRCVVSLRNEPISLYQVQGTQEFPPYRGRALGFLMGQSPYVSYVDPDDYIVPGAFEKLLNAIQSGDYDAAHGWEVRARTGVVDRVYTAPHHAFLLKRGLPINYALEWRVFFTPDGIKKDRVIAVREVLYYRDMGDRYNGLG